MSNDSAREQRWRAMQASYCALSSRLEQGVYSSTFRRYVHPSWEAARTELKAYLCGPLPEQPLAQRHLQGMMVRSGFTVSQEYEVTYLRCCLNPLLTDKLVTFRDTDFGKLPKECQEFSCSVNTLGHLYYAATCLDRYLQLHGKLPETIIELGSGYGNLARIFRHFCPQATIVLIDLPELLALQQFFLQETVPESRVILEQSAQFALQPSGVHLVPAHYLPALNLKGDLFVSTFALSETPLALQQDVIAKRFFRAAVCYLSGQLHNAAPEHQWVDHATLHAGLRSNYGAVSLRPFHVFQNGVMLYEAIASSLLDAPRQGAVIVKSECQETASPPSSPRMGVADHLKAAVTAMSSNNLDSALGHLQAALHLDPTNLEVKTAYDRAQQLRR